MLITGMSTRLETARLLAVIRNPFPHGVVLLTDAVAQAVCPDEAPFAQVRDNSVRVVLAGGLRSAP